MEGGRQPQQQQQQQQQQQPEHGGMGLGIPYPVPWPTMVAPMAHYGPMPPLMLPAVLLMPAAFYAAAGPPLAPAAVPASEAKGRTPREVPGASASTTSRATTERANPHPIEPTEPTSRAATHIQRLYRGHRVRKDFPTLRINDIARARHPAVYQTELLLQELLLGQLIPECLVEVMEEGTGGGLYHPVCRTRDFQCQRLRYHLLEEAASAGTRSILAHLLEELAREVVDTMHSPDPVEDLCCGLVEEVVTECQAALLHQLIRELVGEAVQAEGAQRLLGELVDELVRDLGIPEAAWEAGLEELVLEQLVDQEISYDVTQTCLQVAKALGLRVLVPPQRAQPKSATLDYALDYFLDRALFQACLQEVDVGHGATGDPLAPLRLAESGRHHLLDQLLAQALLRQ
jgi:hypothetical protein